VRKAGGLAGRFNAPSKATTYLFPGTGDAPPSSDLEEELQQEDASAIRVALFDGILIDNTIEKCS
jgi:hypothetical protein